MNSTDAGGSAPSTTTPGKTWPQRASAWGTVVGAALAHAPESAAYGLIALAPLGPSLAPQAMALALLGAGVANLIASLCGAGRLVSGPRASLALLTAGLLGGLLALQPQQGPRDVLQVLVLLGLGLMAAGAVQAFFGLLRLGSIVKFTPHPVRLGLLSGIGLLLVANALPVLFGHGFGTKLLAGLQGISLGATALGLTAMAGSWWATRARWPVPPVLVGLGLASALFASLQALGVDGAMLGGRVAAPSLPAPWLTQGPAVWPASSDLLRWPVLALLATYALTVATLSSLDTLLAASVLDGRLRTSRDANRELRAQGFANMVAGLAGGQANSPSIPRSLALVLPDGGTRHSTLGYGVAVLVLMLLGSGLLGVLPVAAVGGVLVLQGAQMVAPSLWRTPLALWGASLARKSVGYDRAQRRTLLDNWGVAAAVALNTVVLGLGPAVLIGASIAILLFVRANMRDVVRQVRSAEKRRSLKMRAPEAEALLSREGRRIVILELEGALFFGTADALRSRLESLADGVDTAVLDLHQVPEIDATGARILLETGEDWARRGKVLVAAEWASGDARRRTIEAMVAPGQAKSNAGLQFYADTDSALEDAEDRLLNALGLRPDADRLLSLGETLLGQGLSEKELAALAAQMTTHHYPAQQTLFRAGDPGDAMYVSLRGHIGLRLPGTLRRLASFAPGVSLGEMAVLAHRQRSAEAVAEDDLTVMRLSVEAFDRMRAEQPALAAQVLNNISLHLADRVRVLTSELSGWVARSSARGSATAPELSDELARLSREYGED
ncbi:SulP family inorganic anion transporter [Paucibacter sp. AS339]|uniref:SLC26A/SulP transporter family protein n=1 Tax=Paucibacter hankyongi TaxID=3133434 RepID=UPI0030AFE86A